MYLFEKDNLHLSFPISVKKASHFVDWKFSIFFEQTWSSWSQEQKGMVDNGSFSKNIYCFLLLTEFRAPSSCTSISNPPNRWKWRVSRSDFSIQKISESEKEKKSYLIHNNRFFIVLFLGYGEFGIAFFLSHVLCSNMKVR